MQQEIGTLLHLYVDEVRVEEPTEASDFLIDRAAKAISDAGGRNWMPLIVKQVGAEEYEAIANSFVLAAVEEAGLNKVWCIVADDSEATARSARILAGEVTPRLDLSTATKAEIKSALNYLTTRSVNPLTGVKVAIAVDRIAAAPRRYWKESLLEVSDLKCGITKGKRLNFFKEVFYTTPEPLPEVITDKALLETFTVAALKKMAKKRGFSGYSKLKKPALVKLLEAPSPDS